MTNKQTIDGVSRDLIERVNALWPVGSEFGDDGEPLWLPHVMEMINELRALLDKPQSASTPHTCGLDTPSPCLSCKTAAHPQGEPVEVISLSDCVEHHHPEYGAGWFATDNCRRQAQPQGEVERLRYKADLYDEVWELATGLGYMNVTTAIGTLRAQLAERDAVLAKTLEKLKEEYWDKYGGLNEIRELITAALSTSAEPKPRGEEVAKPVAKLHAERLTGRDGEYGVTVEDSQWFNTCRLTGGVFNLYAEQPPHSGDANEMVAKVVLPERMKESRAYGHDLGGNYDEGKADGYNAAIDDVTKINGLKP